MGVLGKWILRKIIKIVGTRCHILKPKCTKFVFGRGFAPNPAGGAYDAPQTPSRLGRGIPPPHSPPPRRLWRLGLGDFSVEITLSPALL